MKYLLPFLLLALLSSCADSYKCKMIKSHAVVRAADYEARNFESGDTVCLYHTPNMNYEYRIYEGSTFKDTIWTYRDSQYYFIYSYSLAVIQ